MSVDPTKPTSSPTTTTTTAPLPAPPTAKIYPSSTRRPPSAPLTVHPTCLIADSTTVSGPHHTSLAASVLIHPLVAFRSEFSPVLVGPWSIICDKATIGITTDPPRVPRARNKRFAHAVEVGAYCLVEAGAIVEGCIGRGTAVEAGAWIGRGASVGRGCRITAGAEVGEGEVVPDGKVVMPVTDSGGAWMGARIRTMEGREKSGGERWRDRWHEVRRGCEAELLGKSGKAWRGDVFAPKPKPPAATGDIAPTPPVGTAK